MVKMAVLSSSFDPVYSHSHEIYQKKLKNDISTFVGYLNSKTKNLNDTLHNSDIQIINSTTKTINNIINKNTNKNIPKVEIYSINCTTNFMSEKPPDPLKRDYMNTSKHY